MKPDKLHLALGAIVMLLMAAMLLMWSDRNDLLKEHQAHTAALYDTLSLYQQLKQATDLLLEQDFEKAISLFQRSDSAYPALSGGLGQKAFNFTASVGMLSDSLRQLDQFLVLNRSQQKIYVEEIGRVKDDLQQRELLLDTLRTTQIDLLTVMNQQFLQTQVLMAENSTLKDSINKVAQSFGEIVFVNRKGVKVSYLGQLRNGKAEGRGVGVYETGGIYKGQWKNNTRNGFGVYRWSNGDQYEGEYKDGERNGAGTYTFKSGEKYIGEWKNDLREGYGEYFSPEGKILLKGTWKENKFVKAPANASADGVE